MSKKEDEENSTTTLDDFFKLGRYTLLICLVSEFCILNQVGNMLYMMYAGNLKKNFVCDFLGVAPPVVGCGEHNFSHILNQHDVCSHLLALQQNDSCVPRLDAQFESVNYEVHLLIIFIKIC